MTEIGVVGMNKGMKIDVVDYVAGAREARGIAVVIDVFRAFSTACYAYEGGAEVIHAVGAVEDALALKEEMPNALLIGEREGKKLPGFDFGNSPTEVNAGDVRGRTLVHTTHAGTQGLVNAVLADEVLTGAFVNAKATVEYIKSRKPERVTLVRMGLEATENSDEDDLCAEYLYALLAGEDFDVSAVVPTLEKSPYGARFFDPEKPWNPESDFYHCLEVDRFDFALKAERGEKRITLSPVRG